MRELDGQGFIADTPHPSDTWLERYIDPADQPHMLAVIQEAIRTKSLFELEHRVLCADGTLGWTHSRAVPLLDERGEIVEWIGAASDITERKEAEEALRASEERLRLLIESAEDYSIFTVDVDGVINSWNEGARRMFGWSAQEIIGQAAEALFTPEDRAAGVPAQELATALHNGRALDEWFHLRKDGSRLYVSGTVSTIHDGELRGFVKIARDLTERKHAEEAL